MLDGFSTAQVALLLVALQFAVMTFGWLIAAQLLPGDRRPASWWAGYAACSAVGLTLIVVGMQAPDEPKRALGNLLMIAATVCLQRGVWAFGARPPANAVQVMVLLVVAVVATMGMSPHWAPLRIGVGSTLWAALYVWVGVEVFAITRRDLRLPYAALCALPMMLTAVMLSLRAWRAAVSPATVLAEVNNDTALNLGSSVSGLVMALVLQLILIGMVLARMFNRLQRLSRHDVLTGLLNRRALDEHMALEAQRVRRLKGAMSVLMVDIDHFKRLNDVHGHAAGDRALQHLAMVMGGQMREIDLLARWGGEEFVAMLPGTDGADALALAERLCERVRSGTVVFDGQVLPLTVTIGVAAWAGEGDSLASLLGRADAALYAGKRAGRNCARLDPDGLREAA